MRSILHLAKIINVNAEIAKSYSWQGEVTKIEDIELPITNPGKGVYIDDFNRLVADNVRKEAKKIYEEQEQNLQEEKMEKEITKIEETVLPLHKFLYVRDYRNPNKYKIYNAKYDLANLIVDSRKNEYYFGENIDLEKLVNLNINYKSNNNIFYFAFYDNLGRKLSDELILEANKLYEKQISPKKIKQLEFRFNVIFYIVVKIFCLFIMAMIIVFLAFIIAKLVKRILKIKCEHANIY